MLLSSIDILMSQNVRYKVNIARFLVQCGTIGASKLMWCNFLGRRNLSGIFFYHILNSLHANSFALGRIEESVLMTGKGSDSLTDLQVSFECFFYLKPKINNHFISTFSGDFDSIILKIYIFNIQPDTFGNTDSGSKKQCNDCQIAFFCFFIKHTFLAGKCIATVFYIIQKHGNFISIQTNNAFFMDFRYINKHCRIRMDHFTFVIIGIKTPQSGDFSFQATFTICFCFIT